MNGFEIRHIDNVKGKGLYATKSFKKGEVIFEENPLVSCQFAWNAVYKYLACDYCMKPLETAEQNVRRLAANQEICLPHPECGPPEIVVVNCEHCPVSYCSESCRYIAWNAYHKRLCYNHDDTGHPIALIMDIWRNMHYPPETTNIMLILRMLAQIEQSQDPISLISKIKKFCHRTINEDVELVHKLLGEKFNSQINTLREMTANIFSGLHVQEYLTPEGFCSLLALIGTNGQGIGTSPLAIWENNITEFNIDGAEKSEIDILIDKLYAAIEKESGSFLDTEGSGLYELQSVCNHSCMPNAEPAFPYGNHCLQLRATKTIEPDDEIFISYLDECSLHRSRHSRQKELALNYLFVCSCEKCQSQSAEPDMTSAEEMSEGEDDEHEDMDD